MQACSEWNRACWSDRKSCDDLSAGQLTGVEIGSSSRVDATAELDVGLGWWTSISTRGALLWALTYTWDLQQHRQRIKGVHSQAFLELKLAAHSVHLEVLVNSLFSARTHHEGLVAGTCSSNDEVSRLAMCC